MNDVLMQIVAATRARLDRDRPDAAFLASAARQAAAGSRPHRFITALGGGIQRTAGRSGRIIAEVKAASPSAGWIVRDPAVEEIAASYAAGGASALSVVTEPDFFHGSRDWLSRGSEASGLPVIMKDFIVEPVQLLEGIAAGADAILLLASLLETERLREFLAILADHGRDALVEVHDERDLERAIAASAPIIGVNNRDLRDFSVSLETSERLVKKIPENVVRVSESGIRSASDVGRLLDAGFDAFLVGESLLRRPDREAAVRELLAPAVDAHSDVRPVLELMTSVVDAHSDVRLVQPPNASKRSESSTTAGNTGKTPVKICGITRLEDALAATDAGADFLGFVFHPASRRFIEPSRAGEIVGALRSRHKAPPQIVGVFVDRSAAEINSIAAAVGLDLVQLHGDEPPELIEKIDRPVIRAIRVAANVAQRCQFRNSEWLLFDTATDAGFGGTGQTFDWRLLGGWVTSQRFFVAGGITPANVGELIESLHPDGIDVSSGVEAAPGIKDREKLAALFAEIRRASGSLARAEAGGRV
jgi:indole-3-glycerol phosphate synthase/phosphoribosylanthranilate isomerase